MVSLKSLLLGVAAGFIIGNTIGVEECGPYFCKTKTYIEKKLDYMFSTEFKRDWHNLFRTNSSNHSSNSAQPIHSRMPLVPVQPRPIIRSFSPEQFGPLSDNPDYLRGWNSVPDINLDLNDPRYKL